MFPSSSSSLSVWPGRDCSSSGRSTWTHLFQADKEKEEKDDEEDEDKEDEDKDGEDKGDKDKKDEDKGDEDMADEDKEDEENSIQNRKLEIQESKIFKIITRSSTTYSISNKPLYWQPCKTR